MTQIFNDIDGNLNTQFNEYVNVGFPSIFIFLTIISSIWFSISFRKRKITSKTSILWITFNIVLFVLFIYLLVIGIIEYFEREKFDYGKYNFVQLLAEYTIGSFDSAWIILVSIIFFILIIIISINIVVQFNVQTKKINELNRNLAILKGKIAININDLSFDTSELAFDELKHLLEEQLAKEKLKAKYKSKFEKLYEGDEEISLDIKTLLNLDDKKDNNEKGDK